MNWVHLAEGMVRTGFFWKLLWAIMLRRRRRAVIIRVTANISRKTPTKWNWKLFLSVYAVFSVVRPANTYLRKSNEVWKTAKTLLTKKFETFTTPSEYSVSRKLCPFQII
jgi:endonuclease III